MKKTIKVLIIIAGIILLSSFAYAASNLPPGLLKVQEYNAELAKQFLQNISFFIAFLAGITSILSPCILPLVPAYFAITFKEKKRITLATFIFFIGFALIFIIMGLLATLTGNTLVSVFSGINWLVPLAGFMLILFGIMIFLGKGFSGFIIKRKAKGNSAGIFISGAAFAIGWTACTGPILSGVLLMASTFRNYLTSSYLMLAYSLGIFAPLFILSFFYDKIHLDKLKWLHKPKTIMLGNKRIETSISNIISGALFVFIGVIFIIFKGTSIFNGLQMFGLKKYFYSLQNIFIENAKTINTIGVIIFLIFISILVYFLAKEIKNNKK